MTDVEFSPTADELDFQKQFGIPLPSLPPKPGVLAKAGGIGLTEMVAAAVYILRRRSARTMNPRPGATGAMGAV